MKVLVIRFSSFGDVVLSTGIPAAIKAAMPDAEVHVLTKRALGELFAGNPNVSKILNLEDGEGVLSLADKVKAEKYDWVVDLHANLRTRLLRLATFGTKWSVYRKSSFKRRLQVLFKCKKSKESHVVERYAKALAPLGVKVVRPMPEIYPRDEISNGIQTLLASADLPGTEGFVLLAPGARWPTKAWPVEKWRELAQKIHDGLGLKSVIVGGRDEEKTAEKVASGLPFVVNLCGITGISQTAEVISYAKAAVTNDSAPMHLAVARGVPVVALFGPTVKAFGFYPLGERDMVVEKDLPCRPCSLHGTKECPKGHHKCMKDISAREVFDCVRVLVAN